MRQEFSAKTKLLAYKRCLKAAPSCLVEWIEQPHCEICGKRILGLPEYDHITPDGLGGEPTLENCQVLCGACHRAKTHIEDRPIMAKADRQMKSAAGIKRRYRWPKRGFSKPYSTQDADT